jgi:folate-binding Fe-S cluster repair protein YgfZ
MADTTLKDRAIIRISGEEARPFLQGLITQDVLTLENGTPRWAGLLTPQGKALFDFILWADGDDINVDCEASQAEALTRRLTLYRLRRKVEIGRDETLAVHWAPDARDKPHDPRLPELGHRWLAPADGGDASAAFRAHRLSLGVTEGLSEIGSDKTLWLEANAEELVAWITPKAVMWARRTPPGCIIAARSTGGWWWFRSGLRTRRGR